MSPTERSRHDFALIPFQSRAVGVLKFGEHKQSAARMVSTDTTRFRGEDDGVVSDVCQSVGESFCGPLGVLADGCGVFSQNEAWMNLLNNAEKLPGKANRLRSVRPGVAVGLAGVTAGDDDGLANLVNELVGSDAPAIAKHDSVDRADDFLVFVFWFTVANPSAKGRHVIMFPNTRPMFRQHPAAVRVDFDLSNAGEPGAFKSKVEPTHATE